MSLNEEQPIENPETNFQEVEEPSDQESLDAAELALSEMPVVDAGKSKEKGQKHHYIAFVADLEKQPDADAKIQSVVAFMENSLSQHGSPHFKSFWDARNLCLELFKENINSTLRAEMWTKYTELSKEARRLKEILDEQSAFAAEQIDIAIQALVQDIQTNQEKIDSDATASWLVPCFALERKAKFYEQSQGELNLLNAQASRINALRKELIRTEMRVRQKNKFFQQLSAAGDMVFPRRKELIKEISQHFMTDVETFINNNLNAHEYQGSLFALREEIKTLQGIAKSLTLNTHAFTQTRLCLSKSWDQIKNAEKERKKERSQQKEIYKQNAQIVQSKIEEFRSSFAGGELTTNAAHEKIDEIFNFMKSTDLGRDEIKQLRDELSIARKPLLDKIKAEEDARAAADQERERQKKERIQNLKDRVDHLLQTADEMEIESLISTRDDLFEEIAHEQMTKLQRQELERALKPIKEVITDKKEKALLNLSEDDREALNQLKELLKQRKERRQNVKIQIEAYRKASGNSGFDFEKAMAFNAQLAEEKERFEKLNEGIREIEQKVAELENKA